MRKRELLRREGTCLGLQLRVPITLLRHPQQNGDKGSSCSLPLSAPSQAWCLACVSSHIPLTGGHSLNIKVITILGL